MVHKGSCGMGANAPNCEHYIPVKAFPQNVNLFEGYMRILTKGKD